MTVARDRRPDVGSPVRIRVSVDCPGALPVLCPDAAGGIGGAEVRAVTFAHALAERPEFDLAMIVSSELPRPTQKIDGLTVHFEPRRLAQPSTPWEAAWRHVQAASIRWSGSMSKRWVGVPARRPFHERLAWDTLLCFGVTNRTASLVRSARRTGRRAIVFLTTDRTLDDLQRRGRRDRGVYGELGCLCRYAVRNAAEIVVQKKSQQLALRQRFGLESHLIRNPIRLETVESPRDELPRLPASPCVLWVGRGDTFSKRADLCLALARRCPAWPFVVVMNRHEEAAYAQLLSHVPPNVTLIERVSLAVSDQLYQRARLVINTSMAEGFPNSFLQAGKYGVPVVSLHVDPDGLLNQVGGGVCVGGDLAAMAGTIERLMLAGDDYRRMASAIAKYTAEFHGLPECAARLAQLILEGTPRVSAA